MVSPQDAVRSIGPVPAHAFDGRSSTRRAVQVALDGETLRLWWADEADVSTGPREPVQLPLSALRVAEAVDTRAPLPIQLPGGATLWLEGEACQPLREALSAAGTPRWAAVRLIRSWPAALACTLVLVALLVWIDRQGAGLAAAALLRVLPTSVDVRVGDALQSEVWAHWAVDRTEHEARLDRVASRFLAAAAVTDPDWAPKLSLSFVRERRQRGDDVGEPGFNAFALPNGAIFVFDGMVEKLSDDELLAVLGHELGHVRYRHGMQRLARGIGLLAAAGVVFGDLSTVAATAVGTVQLMRHSRDDEREADAYALRFMQAAGVPPQTLISVWLKFGAEMQRLGAGEPPGWIASHPGIEERLESARRAASAPR